MKNRKKLLTAALLLAALPLAACGGGEGEGSSEAGGSSSSGSAETAIEDPNAVALDGFDETIVPDGTNDFDDGGYAEESGKAGYGYCVMSGGAATLGAAVKITLADDLTIADVTLGSPKKEDGAYIANFTEDEMASADFKTVAASYATDVGDALKGKALADVAADLASSAFSLTTDTENPCYPNPVGDPYDFAGGSFPSSVCRTQIAIENAVSYLIAANKEALDPYLKNDYSAETGISASSLEVAGEVTGQSKADGSEVYGSVAFFYESEENGNVTVGATVHLTLSGTSIAAATLGIPCADVEILPAAVFAETATVGGLIGSTSKRKVGFYKAYLELGTSLTDALVGKTTDELKPTFSEASLEYSSIGTSCNVPDGYAFTSFKYLDAALGIAIYAALTA